MMIRGTIKLELARSQLAQFAQDAGRLNSRAVEGARAQHERHRSVLAAEYRLGRFGPQAVEPGAA